MMREVYCHAANLFFEARGETPLGQRWVLDVVKNRVYDESYPDTYCEVITQYRQFSWYNDLYFELPGDPIHWEEYILIKYQDSFLELNAWRYSFSLALQHYLTTDGDITDGSIYYMTLERYNERGAFNRTVSTGIIGSHIFFKKCNSRKSKSCFQF